MSDRKEITRELMVKVLRKGNAFMADMANTSDEFAKDLGDKYKGKAEAFRIAAEYFEGLADIYE